MEWIINKDEDYLAIQEIIAQPLLFTRECCGKDIQADHHGRIFNNMLNNKYSLNLVARQLGKSATAMLYIYWYAMNNPDKNIVIAAPTQVLAQSLLDMVRDWIQSGPTMLKELGLLENNRNMIRLYNGTRIGVVAATARNLRGMTINILYLDEFAYVPATRQKDIIHSIMPVMAACSGQIIINTTANNTTDMVYGMMSAPEWSKCVVPASDVRSQLWLDDTRHYMSDIQFRREYECEFVDG